MNEKLSTLLELIRTTAKTLELQQSDLYDTLATPLQTGLINLLGNEGALTAVQVAKARQSSRQNVQVVLNELLTLGIVSSQTNPRHKRSVYYKLSSTGEAIYAHNHEAYDKYLKVLGQSLSEQEVHESVEVLKKLSLALH